MLIQWGPLDFQLKRFYPALIADQERMKNAYVQNTQLVKLDTPIVVDYAYRDTPEMILEGIKEIFKPFLLNQSQNSGIDRPLLFREV